MQREAIVGSRTTLDVLNAEQALLNSQVTLVQNLANLVTASYTVASAIGRLTARDLNLPVPIYDETAYYNAVQEQVVRDSATTPPTSPAAERSRAANAITTAPTNPPPAGGDPSMEDILASIRRILSEDEPPPSTPPPPAPKPNRLAHG